MVRGLCKEKTYRIWCILLFAIWVLGFIAMYLSDSCPWENGIMGSVLHQWGNLLNTSVVIFAIIIAMHRFNEDLYGTFRDGFLKGIKLYIKGFLIGAILFSAVTAIIYFSKNAVVNKTGAQPIGMDALPGIMILLTGWMVQGASEEFLMRGVILKYVSRKINVILGIFISSILFAALHFANNGISIMALINLMLFGVAMALYVIKTRSLWGAAAIHTSWNFFQGNIYGFYVSGINIPVGTAIDLDVCGSPFISGGTFGPEAGIVTTAVQLSFIFIMILLMLKDKNILCRFKSEC